MAPDETKSIWKNMAPSEIPSIQKSNNIYEDFNGMNIE